MSAQDLWDKLDALPWPGPWVAHTFEVDCPCPNGEDCGAMHDCTEVEDRTAYPSSPEEPAEPGHGQCVVQINTPGLETFAKPCAEFIAAARNELPAIRARLAELEMQEHNDDANRYHQNVITLEPEVMAALAAFYKRAMAAPLPEPRCERCDHQRTVHAGDSGPCDAAMCSCLEFQGT